MSSSIFKLYQTLWLSPVRHLIPTHPSCDLLIAYEHTLLPLQEHCNQKHRTHSLCQNVHYKCTCQMCVLMWHIPRVGGCVVGTYPCLECVGECFCMIPSSHVCFYPVSYFMSVWGPQLLVTDFISSTDFKQNKLPYTSVGTFLWLLIKGKKASIHYFNKYRSFLSGQS